MVRKLNAMEGARKEATVSSGQASREFISCTTSWPHLIRYKCSLRKIILVSMNYACNIVKLFTVLKKSEYEIVGFNLVFIQTIMD